MKWILLVDDDSAFLTRVQNELKEDTVRVAQAFEEAKVIFEERPPDVVVISAPADGGKALEWIESFRRYGTKTKFILTSPSPNKDFLIRSLNFKVDAFLEEPYATEALKKRIAEVTEAPSSDEIQVDFFRRAVILGQEAIPLTRTEFSLFLLFRQRPGTFMSRHEIETQIWPDSTVAKNNLDTHLSRLRSKIPPLKSRLLCLRGEGFVYTPSGAGPEFVGRSAKRR